MKNLNNEDKPNFEKHWEDAFKEAELEPSEDVWLKIDSALANQESNGLKRTIIFYRYAAAVSLLLLLSTAVVSLYIFNEDSISSGDLSKHSHESEEYVIHSPNSDPGIALHNNDVNEALINENNNSEEITHHDNKDNIKADENTFLSSEEQADRENGSLKNIIRNKSLAVDKEASQFSSHSGENLNNVIKPDKEKDETGSYGGGINEYQPLNLIASKAFEPITTQFNKLQKEIYGVPVKNAKEKKDEKSVSANGLFAGIQFTPGYFDPNIQMNKGNAALSANRAAFSQMGVNPTNQEQDLQPQMSYTYGLNFGVKVAKRWLVNMGLQYAKNNTSGTTQQFFHNEDNSMRILATPTTLNLVNESTADVAFNGAPYSMNSIDLNNNFEFASI
ncbi:MAG: hypothetical protein M3421_15705, partial [Bacteroidota bacterium]|nr:hypothetical protein [Bacteroidota bacterium]